MGVVSVLVWSFLPHTNVGHCFGILAFLANIADYNSSPEARGFFSESASEP